MFKGFVSRVVGGGSSRVAPDEAPDPQQAAAKQAETLVEPLDAEQAGWASSAVAAVAHVAGSAASAARGVSDTAAPAATGAANAAAQAAAKAASVCADTAADAAASARLWAQEKIREFRRMIETWVKQKIYRVASRAMERVPSAIKNALEDDDMPRCVSRGKDRLVDNTWPHIQEEVLWELAVSLDGESPTAKQDGKESRGADCFRAFFRYHLYPFDKSFWRQMRDPVSWCFTIIELVPVHGISPASFLFRFLIIDKSDDFQLIQFILSFKGMQFLTQGVIRSLTGYFIFVSCVTAPAHKEDHRCAQSGPGVYGKAGIAGLAGYLLSCILVWIAFALLRCSTDKGRSTLKGALAKDSERQQQTIRMKAGVLFYFLWWDIFVLCVFIGVCAWVITTRPTFALDDWALAQAIFAGQIVHGLLSAPFFFFTLPGLARVLTHSVPTAYDRCGRCVPPKLTPSSEQSRQEVETKPRQPLVSEEEASELWARLRSKAGLPKVPGFAD